MQILESQVFTSVSKVLIEETQTQLSQCENWYDFFASCVITSTEFRDSVCWWLKHKFNSIIFRIYAGSLRLWSTSLLPLDSLVTVRSYQGAGYQQIAGFIYFSSNSYSNGRHHLQDHPHPALHCKMLSWNNV